MSLLSYEPFYDWDRWDRFWDDTLGWRALSSPVTQLQRREEEAGALRSFRPRMDLHENKDTNTVTASFELPGVQKNDVNIDFQNGRLLVSAESKASTQYDERGYTVKERRYGRYARTLQLPEGVKEKDVKAAMDNGVLTVQFPKTTPEQAAKKITIA